ncbi:MAG: NfeD family protein [Halobacteriaceae archaeon]
MASVFGYSLSLVLVVAGVALCVAEAMAPGAHFIVLGVALLVAGLVGLLLGGPGGVPLLSEPIVLAGVVLLVGAATLYAYRAVDVYAGDQIGRTSDSDDLTGKRGVVTQRVTRSGGTVRLDDGGFDPTFSARPRGDELPEGTEIVVVDPGGGSVLTVQSLAAYEAEQSGGGTTGDPGDAGGTGGGDDGGDGDRRQPGGYRPDDG